MGYFNQGYSSSFPTVDFSRCKTVIEELVRESITSEPSGEKRLYEYAIVDKIKEQFPETEGLGLIKFLGMLHEALLASGRPYKFEREAETKRSFFTGIQVRGDDGNTAPKTDKPDQKAPIAFDVLDAFLGHIEQADDDTRVRVRDVKEIHRKLDISENYSDVLKALKALDGVSSEEEISDGKTRKYLTGLTLTKSGKKLLAE